MPYQFATLEALTQWLLTSKWGGMVIREVLDSPNGFRFCEEHVERAAQMRPAHVVVELHGDGYVQVYGPSYVRVRIVQRPVSSVEDRAKASSLIDEWIALNMPIPYREIYWPSYCRASGQVERVSVRQVAERENEREFQLAVLDALSKGVK